jgi:predicted nucleic acid-binding protein
VGWIEDLRGKVVGLDTAPLIYYIERNSLYIDRLRPFFQAVDRGEISIVTSIITLTETLVHPLRNGNTDLADRYRDMLLHTKGLTTLQLSADIAEEAAQLRASHNIRTPDSIQMATAIKAGVPFFLTNDTCLPSSPRLQVLILNNLTSL